MKKFSPFQYSYCGHPHGVMLQARELFFKYAYLRGSLATCDLELDLKLLSSGLLAGFNDSGNASFAHNIPFEVDGECIDIATYMRDDFESDNGEIYENQVPWFKDQNKYVVRAAGTNWGYWESCRPFEFPAVAYSREEIQVWFLWSLTKDLLPHLATHQQESVWEVADKFIDIKRAEELMNLLFSGNKRWTYGPARKHEPNFELWHKLTGDHLMNKVILEFPTIRPENIQWWKDLPWSGNYEMDFDAFW